MTWRVELGLGAGAVSGAGSISFLLKMTRRLCYKEGVQIW